VSCMSQGSPTKHTSTLMVTLKSKVSDFGSQRIEGLTLPTLHPDMQCSMPYQEYEYTVPCSSMYQSLLMFRSVCWDMNLSLY
jgi:hypothetical protein